MISDTPRMKAAQMAAMEHMTGDVYRVGCDIERELNAANVEIEEKRKDVVWLATEKAKLEERIKRLEEENDAKDNQISNLLHICRDNDIEVSSQDLINGREEA
jgi:predicted  nucleic acid-binding Zn-ribbon protein